MKLRAVADTTTGQQFANTSTGQQVANTTTGQQVANTTTSGQQEQVANTSIGQPVANTTTGQQVANTTTGQQVANTSTGQQVSNTTTGQQVAGPLSGATVQATSSTRQGVTSIAIRGVSVVSVSSLTGFENLLAKQNVSELGKINASVSSRRFNYDDKDSTMNLVLSFDDSPRKMQKNLDGKRIPSSGSNIRTISSISCAKNSTPIFSSTSVGISSSTAANIPGTPLSSSQMDTTPIGLQRPKQVGGGVARGGLTLTLPSKGEQQQPHVEASDVSTLTPELTPRSDSNESPPVYSNRAFTINSTSIATRGVAVTHATNNSRKQQQESVSVDISGKDWNKSGSVGGERCILDEAVKEIYKEDVRPEKPLRHQEYLILNTDNTNIVVQKDNVDIPFYSNNSSKSITTEVTSSNLYTNFFPTSTTGECNRVIERPAELILSHLPDSDKTCDTTDIQLNCQALPTPSYSPVTAGSQCLNSPSCTEHSPELDPAFTFDHHDHEKNITLNQLSKRESPESELIASELEDLRRRNADPQVQGGLIHGSGTPLATVKQVLLRIKYITLDLLIIEY